MNSSKGAGATIRQVAEHARVSPMSVSNYLNGRFNLMRDETRERIGKAVAELEYRPRHQARAFRQRKDFSVGMMVVDPSPNFLVEPFIGHVVTGLSTELATSGYACLLQGVPSCDGNEAAIENLSRCDAICLFPSGPDEARARLFGALSALGRPLVMIEEQADRIGGDCAVVRQDDADGAETLAAHLLGLGARDFLYVTPSPVWPANLARREAFETIFANCAEQARFSTLRCGFGNFDEVHRAVDEWLEQGGQCDAILGNNDHIGIAVLKALSERGVQVPADMLVTGFGGFELWNYSHPRLTTVVCPAYDLGRIAARALLERLRDGSFSRSEWVLPVTLRLGESTPAAPRLRNGRAVQRRQLAPVRAP